MDTKKLVDPEILPLIEVFPTYQFSALGIDTVREQSEAMVKAMPPVSIEDVSVREELIDNGTSHQVRVLVYAPKDDNASRPALLHIHGGGFVIGTPEMNDARNQTLSNELGAVIVSVDYRLAPEHQFPLPVEDCYTALKWLFENASAFGVDKNRIGIYGESGGGGLSAALAILARDRKEVQIAHQFLIYPMLDDRTCVGNDANPYTGEFIWTRESNHFGWSSLLGKEPGSGDVSPYAAAARVDSVVGLPPTYICAGALDLFLDEDIRYAHRLLKAGVPTELHIYPGAFHAFDMAPDAEISKQFQLDFIRALKKALVTG